MKCKEYTTCDLRILDPEVAGCWDKVCNKKEYHTSCHDCGRFLKKELWIAKDHIWKKHALCRECISNYD